MNRPWARILFVVSLAIVILYCFHPWCAKYRVRSRAIRLMQGTTCRQELSRIVGATGGGFLEFPDGSWIAIYYERDRAWRRSMLDWNQAVALDSTGVFYESDRDYSTLFGRARAFQENRRILIAELRAKGLTDAEFDIELQEYDRDPGGVNALAVCPSLGEAVEMLRSLGFREMGS